MIKTVAEGIFILAVPPQQSVNLCYSAGSYLKYLILVIGTTRYHSSFSQKLTIARIFGTAHPWLKPKHQLTDKQVAQSTTEISSQHTAITRNCYKIKVDIISDHPI